MSQVISPSNGKLAEFSQCSSIYMDQELLLEDENSDTETVIAEKKRPKYKYMKFLPSALKHVTFNHRFSIQNPARYTDPGVKFNMCFKMVKSDSRLIKSVLFSYGFLHCSRKNPNVNVIWSNTHMPGHVLRSLLPWQRLNHFPRSVSITKKDLLHQNLCLLQKYFPDYYDFFPESYILPDDNAIIEKKLLHKNSFPPMISKPAASSRGRGITIITTTEEFRAIEAGGKNKVLLSRYLKDPYLVNDRKFDIRLYVAVTSFQPLVCYMFDEGLTRFAVEEYVCDDGTFSESYKHLTNYSLNKNSKDFIKNTDASEENVGHKWTLGAILRELKNQKIDTKLLMVRMEDIVIKTLLSIQSQVSAAVRSTGLGPNVCFELFGFDILIDRDLKPWLLEVNLSPSLACDAPLDAILKTKVVCDTLNLAMIPYVASKNILNTNSGDDENALEIPETDAVSSTSVSSVPPSRSTSPTSSASSRQKGYRKIPNAERPVNPLPISLRVKTIAGRIKFEKNRKGNFIRIFPRKDTYHLYKPILDEQDHRCERQDDALYKLLFQENPDEFEMDHDAIQGIHKELSDCRAYPATECLSENAISLLKEAISTADAYEMEKHKPNGKTLYPKALPKLRPNSRRRTVSQVTCDLARREARVLAVAEAKAKEEIQQADDVPMLSQVV
ncbi:hypothetical protein FO519_000117 [Halicephalobus sp. NKZ332]|nr:hypothetical protein FO519_000117 [Halicephalobus sp. NKZ332]